MKLISEDYNPYVRDRRYDKDGILIGSTTVLQTRVWQLTPEEVQLYNDQKAIRQDKNYG
jgi:hypothetical protein